MQLKPVWTKASADFINQNSNQVTFLGWPASAISKCSSMSKWLRSGQSNYRRWSWERAWAKCKCFNDDSYAGNRQQGSSLAFERELKEKPHSLASHKAKWRLEAYRPAASVNRWREALPINPPALQAHTCNSGGCFTDKLHHGAHFPFANLCICPAY